MEVLEISKAELVRLQNVTSRLEDLIRKLEILVGETHER